MLKKSLLAAPTLLLPRKSSAWTHGSPLTPPAPALAVGFTKLAFYDDFNFASIDFADTGNAGYNWYVNFTNGNGYADGGSFPPVTMSDVTVSSSILSLQNSAGNDGFQGLCSAKFNSNGTLKSGNVFQNGGFFNFVFRYDETLAPTNVAAGGTSWPSVAFNTYSAFVQGTFPDAELDLFEAPPCGFGALPSCQGTDVGSVCNTNKQFNFNWRTTTLDTINAGVAVNGSFQTNGQNWNNMQTIGTLWMPMAKNGGTGYIKRYFGPSNGEMPIMYQTYTATGMTAFPNGGNSLTGPNTNGIFSTLDSQLNPLLLYGALDWPILVDSVAVWTA
jgi:hypothetical protein